MDKIKYTVGILDNLVYTEKNYAGQKCLQGKW